MAKKPINEIIESALEATTKTTKKAASKAKPKAKPKPKKPAIELTRAQKSELNSAAHWAARDKDLADRAAAKAKEKAAKREQNRSMWREMQSDRSLKRQQAWDKYKKKKGME